MLGEAATSIEAQLLLLQIPHDIATADRNRFCDLSQLSEIPKPGHQLQYNPGQGYVSAKDVVLWERTLLQDVLSFLSAGPALKKAISLITHLDTTWTILSLETYSLISTTVQ